MSNLESTHLADIPEGSPQHDGAVAFVKKSWITSWRNTCPRHDRIHGNEEFLKTFHRTFPLVATRLVEERQDVHLLHFEGNLDLFLGFISFDVRDPSRLHYVYVKQSFRKAGHAQWLLDKHLSGEVTYSLRPVQEWKRQWLARCGYCYDAHALMIGDK